MTTLTEGLTREQADALEHIERHPRSVLVGSEADHLPAIAALIGGLADAGQLHRPAFGRDDHGRESAIRPLPILYLTHRSRVLRTVAQLCELLPALTVVSATASVEGDREDRAVFQAFLERHPTGVDCIVATPQLADSRRELYELMQPGIVIVGDAWALKSAGARHTAVTWLSESSERVIVISSRRLEAMTPVAAWATVAAAGLPGIPSRSDFQETNVVWRRTGYGRRDLWRTAEARAEFLALAAPWVLGGITAEPVPSLEPGERGEM